MTITISLAVFAFMCFVLGTGFGYVLVSFTMKHALAASPKLRRFALKRLAEIDGEAPPGDPLG